MPLRPGRNWCWLALGLAVVAGACQAPEATPVATLPQRATWGAVAPALALESDPFEDSGVRGIVLYSCATDCPVANALAPEVSRLQEEYADRGIVWFAIYPDALVTPGKIIAHQAAYGLTMPAQTDAGLRAARAAGFTATPEVAVFARDGTMIYRGRIDDSWDAIGTRRRAPQSRDLKRALDALVSGEPLEFWSTAPVGCLLPPPPAAPR